MRVFIPSYNRPKTIKTPWTLTAEGTDESIDFRVVLHNEEQKALYLEAGQVLESEIVVSGIPLDMGLGGQREWIERELVSDGEVYLQMDDNVQSFAKLEEPYYQQDSFQLEDDRQEQERLFNQIITPMAFMTLCETEMVAKMDELGTCVGGFASTKNTFFRAKKWTDIGFVVGKVLVLRKNDKAKFNSKYFTSDDYQITAENLLYYGAVARNNFVYPNFPRYMAGGLGHLHERWAPYATAAKQLMEDYPGLYNFSRRADMPFGSSVKMRTSNPNSLRKWRLSMGVGVE